MPAGGPTAYDDVPYTSFPYFESHPDRLRLVGHLFGMRPAPVDRCRVLEIACGSGGNIIPVAELHPDSRFLGLDLAGSQIEAGRATVATLGLANIELRHQDLCDLDVSDGPFDYIIAHGVYSWVPEATRRRLLDVCASLLAPHGVAMVSHNVKPGWYPRTQARELMLWHAGRHADPSERVMQARAFLSFLVTAARPEEERHRAILQAELEHVSAMPDWVILHDYLADVNDGCYFHELCAELPGLGLQFLGDADLATMVPHGFDPAVRQVMGQLAPDVIGHEQLLDFLRNRAFRMTLLVKAGVSLDRSLTVGQLGELHLSAQTEEGVDGHFRTPGGKRFEPKLDETRVALRRLGQLWPRSIPGAELVVQAELLEALGAGIVQLSLTPARCGPPGERPRAQPHARLQSGRGSMVTNLRHENERLGPEARHVLEMLDGSRDLEALRKATLLPVDVMLDELTRRALLFSP